jgi:hypothetical protein
MANELPDNVLTLLKQGVPTYAAAEYLLLIRKAEHVESIAELCAMRQPAAEVREVESYLSGFRSLGLIKREGDAIQYTPASPEIESAVEALAAAYNEQPVTLIRTLYALAGSPIQSFADSFKFTED